MAAARVASSTSACGFCKAALPDLPVTCSQCFQVSYCDDLYQRPHWKYHRRVCQVSESPPSSTPQKAHNVAAALNLIPKAAKLPFQSDEVDEKEVPVEAATALRQAILGKQERWAEKDSVREHLRTKIWPDQANHWVELDYTLKPYLDVFFQKKVKVNALDLGTGIGSNLAVLIDVGFIHITIVDNFAGFKTNAEKLVQALTLDTDNELLEVMALGKNIKSDDASIFPRDQRFGAIIARRVFEFCAPDDFENLLIACHASLEVGGGFMFSVNFLDSTKPDLYDRYWKGGEWGFTSEEEVRAAQNFLKSLGFEVYRLRINHDPNHPEVLFLCEKI